MSKFDHLKNNQHGCKEHPRDKSWGGARANGAIVSLAKKKAKAGNESLADYLERLVLEDLKKD